MPPEFSRKVKFGNFTYNLYCHSLLHFGQNVAFELLKESLLPVPGHHELDTESLHREKPMDPCTPRGYAPEKEALKVSPSLIEKKNYLSTFFPSGNFSECRSASLKLLQRGQEKCSYRTCYIGSTFIPKLQGKFLATENFFHTPKFTEGFYSKREIDEVFVRNGVGLSKILLTDDATCRWKIC